MSREFIVKSIFVALLRKGYYYIERYFKEIYKNSQMQSVIKKILNKSKIYFRYSFLWKITEIDDKKNVMLWDSSMLIQWLRNSYKKLMDRLIFYLEDSKITNLIRQLRGDIHRLPIKKLNIIVSVAVMTNIIFCIFLKKEIGIWGWIMRVLFLFVGLIGLFCKANLEDVKRTNFILRGMGLSQNR